MKIEKILATKSPRLQNTQNELIKLVIFGGLVLPPNVGQLGGIFNKVRYCSKTFVKESQYQLFVIIFETFPGQKWHEIDSDFKQKNPGPL